MKISTKLGALLLMGGIAFSNTSSAQEEISDLIKANPADATALTKAYLEPFFKGTGLGLNSGWASTGTTKKLLRFDVKIGATLAMPPASAKSFDVTKIGLSDNIRYNGNPVSSQSNIFAPTIAGAEEDGPRLSVYSEGNNEVTQFTLPKGLNVPMPGVQVQANIGLVKGIEAMVRYSPDIKAGDDFGTIGMKGGGIKFQPFKLIPGGKKIAKLVPVDIAMAVGYNSIKYSYDDINVQKKDGVYKNPTDGTKDFSTQRFEVEFSGLSVEAIASKKLLIFAPFVSVGYVSSNTKAGLYGNYPIATGVAAGVPTYEVFTDPVKIDEKYVSGMRAAAGLNVNLFLFHIYASYNIAPYQYVNAGVGIGFGK